ncbi:MAG TPA: hypothetical protein VFD01_07895 [Candidatus Dormibacteraeota bacterium]|jgi:hypothetical protein|nr:hypothetical protein [Candidatus Dormibacteraeota bacterium]
MTVRRRASPTGAGVGQVDGLAVVQEPEGELPDLLRTKVRAAELHRDPYWRADGRPGPGS